MPACWNQAERLPMDFKENFFYATLGFGARWPTTKDVKTPFAKLARQYQS